MRNREIAIDGAGTKGGNTLEMYQHPLSASQSETRFIVNDQPVKIVESAYVHRAFEVVVKVGEVDVRYKSITCDHLGRMVSYCNANGLEIEHVFCLKQELSDFVFRNYHDFPTANNVMRGLG